MLSEINVAQITIMSSGVFTGDPGVLDPPEQKQNKNIFPEA